MDGRDVPAINPVDLLRLHVERRGEVLFYDHLETSDVDGPAEEWTSPSRSCSPWPASSAPTLAEVISHLRARRRQS